MIDDDDLTDAQLRARKVKPQYGEGPLVKVAWAKNQAEAELIAGLLLEHGVPSVIRRDRGFDVPDFLAAGPRDILVAASGADIAHDVLGTRTKGTVPSVQAAPWRRVLAFTLLVVVGFSLLAAVVAALLG